MHFNPVKVSFNGFAISFKILSAYCDRNKVYLRFICKTTVALEACVMFEFEARHVKVESTSLLCTGPTTISDEVTISFSLTLSPEMNKANTGTVVTD